MKQISSKENIRTRLKASQTSPLQVYKNLTVGEKASIGYFILYECLIFFLSPLPGGLGFFLRKKFYPLMFKKVGRGLIIGRDVVLRHPASIILGDNVTIDDNCLIDARGAGLEGIRLDDNVIINRNCIIQAKTGSIHLRERTTIGSNSVIVSMDGVEFGESVLVAGGCTFSAGSYHFNRCDLPIMDQGVYTTGPIHVKANSWIGTNATILDGVTIGAGAVVGACSLVRKDIPDNMVAAGVPAKILKENKSL